MIENQSTEVERKYTNDMRRHSGKSIFIYDNILTDKQCNEIIDVLNNSTLRHEEYSSVNYVSCSAMDAKDIKDHCLNKKINSYIYDGINHIVQNLSKDHSIICRSHTGFILRIINNGTKYHPDSVVDDFGYYIKNNIPIPNNKIRIVTLIIALNDDYEGGEFCFPNQNVKIKLKKGQAIAFPPYWSHPHYTNDLENGTLRYTVSTWLTQ